MNRPNTSKQQKIYELTSENAQTHDLSSSEESNTDSLGSELDDIENELENIQDDDIDDIEDDDDENDNDNDEDGEDTKSDLDNFNEFALKHLSELLINLFTSDDKNIVFHLNNNLQQLGEKLDTLNETQKFLIKSVEENVKVNKVIAKLLDKSKSNN